MKERPMDLFTEYERRMDLRGVTYRHIKEQMSVLRKHACADMTEEKVVSAMVQYRDKSPRTRNYVRGALSAFCRWLVQKGQLDSNPVELVPRAKSQPVRYRRALNEEELEKLLMVSPTDRSVVYALAANTGLRKGELKRVRLSHVYLDERLIRLPAALTKGRRPCAQPLPMKVVDMLEDWIDDRELKEDDLLFKPFPGIKAWHGDLRRAGIPEQTRDGRVDFHALRVTYGTRLVKRGVPLHMTQRLMRHQDPKITAQFYLHLHEEELRGAASVLDD